MMRKTDIIMSKEYAEAHSGPTSNRVHKWATLLSYALIAFMMFIFTIHLSAFTGWMAHNNLIPNPHYGEGLTPDQEGDGERKCGWCHDYPSATCDNHNQGECVSCHSDDKLAARLHDRSVLILCTTCHQPNIYVSYMHDGNKREVDVTYNHPYGMGMTPKTYPLTLPLRNGLTVTCVTCHDMHDPTPGRKMLRLYREGEPMPENVKALCHDCHHSNGVL